MHLRDIYPGEGDPCGERAIGPWVVFQDGTYFIAPLAHQQCFDYGLESLRATSPFGLSR
jgi:hypothetical protein